VQPEAEREAPPRALGVVVAVWEEHRGARCPEDARHGTRRCRGTGRHQGGKGVVLDPPQEVLTTKPQPGTIRDDVIPAQVLPQASQAAGRLAAEVVFGALADRCWSGAR